VVDGVCLLGIHFGLDALPDVVAGLMCRLKEKAGLVCDVLQVSYKGRTVFAGLEVISKFGIFRNAISTGCKELGELFLEIGAGKFARGLIRRHFTVSLRLSCRVDGSG
jgi:hypothetical protein